jgi:forespore regulator of the sigma-K checkpoint
MRAKGFLYTIVSVALFVLLLIEAILPQELSRRILAEGNSVEEMNIPTHVDVVLKRLYLDGEISEETVSETIYTTENFWSKYDDWHFIGIVEDKLVFRKEMDDISPLLKANGYFGVTDEGILTIFNGKPYKSNIIQTFFQIDVGKLESRKREELKNGIPIKTKDHYVEVLETFKTYSKQDKIEN